tara:strand:+ start:4 stop:570 length:567 start_codon:yes stop_codon:yes gene_type:complete
MKVKISKKNLSKLVNEVILEMKEASDKGDREGKMAQGQLNRTGELASMIKKEFDVNTDLPEWVESKITKAEDYLSTVFNYMRGKDEEDIEEATVTSDIQGYNSPYAFGDGGKLSKKKKKRNSTNSTGFKMVKEKIDNSVDKILESIKTDINEEITNKDLIKLKGIIRNEVASILRDIWLRRSVWAQQR